LAYPRFIADKGWKYTHNFPGWDELNEACGTTRHSMKLMSALLSDNKHLKLFRQCISADDDARRVISESWYWMLSERNRSAIRNNRPAPVLTAEEVSLMLLLELIVPGDAKPPTDREGDGRYGVGIRCNVFVEMKRSRLLQAELEGNGAYGKCLRMLSTKWVETRTTPLGLRDTDSAARYVGIPNNSLFDRLAAVALDESSNPADVVDAITKLLDLGTAPN
jgi:hypothetical protein